LNRFGICDLFGIWCLEFVILDTKLQGRAIYLWPGPEDQVFNVKIKRCVSRIDSARLNASQAPNKKESEHFDEKYDNVHPETQPI